MLRCLKLLCLGLTITVLAAGVGSARISRLALSQMQEEEVHSFATCTSQRRQTVNFTAQRLTNRNLAAVLKFALRRAISEQRPASTLSGAEHSLRNGFGLPLLC